METASIVVALGVGSLFTPFHGRPKKIQELAEKSSNPLPVHKILPTTSPSRKSVVGERKTKNWSQKRQAVSRTAQAIDCDGVDLFVIVCRAQLRLMRRLKLPETPQITRDASNCSTHTLGGANTKMMSWPSVRAKTRYLLLPGILASLLLYLKVRVQN